MSLAARTALLLRSLLDRAGRSHPSGRELAAQRVAMSIVPPSHPRRRRRVADRRLAP